MVHLNLDSRDLAKTYDAASDSQLASGKQLVQRLAVGSGDTVLDIGAGTGRLGAYVLNLIGPSGRFIGIDPLPERIALAKEKQLAANAEFRVGIGEELSFLPDESVDVVYLSSVFHWITDKPKALREIRRVLKRGGRVGLTTGARELARVTCFRQVTDRVLSREPYASVVDLNDYATQRHGVTSSQLVELFLDAGLSLLNLEIVPRRRSYPTGKDAVDFLESSTFGNYLNHVPEKLRDLARREIIAEFDAERGSGPVPFTGYSIFAIGAPREEKGARTADSRCSCGAKSCA